MADSGLFIGWGHVVRGREERALDIFNEALEFYGRLQQEGRIESFDVALLEPHGGDLSGFIMLRGSEQQMDQIRHDEEFMHQMQRADLIVDRLGLVTAYIGEGLQRQITSYREELSAVGV